MKRLYAIIFICIAIILTFCVALSVLSKKKNAKYLRYPLIFALLPTIANIILMVCTTQAESNLAYGIFYGSINWILLTMVRYCAGYTQVKPKPNWLPWMLLGMTIMDSVSMIINPVLHHAYQCIEVAGANGEIYYISKALLWFNIHLGYSYALSALSLGILIYKLRITAIIYWQKYVIVILSFSIVLIWDSFFVTNTDEINKSIIGFGISSVLLTYFTLIYKQRPLVFSMLKQVVYNSSDMVFLYSDESECIFANDSAMKFFNLTEDTLNKSKDHLKSILKSDYSPVAAKEYVKIFTTFWQEKKVHLKVEYKLIEKHDRIEGCFYRIWDYTENVSKMEMDHYKSTHNDLTGLYNKNAVIEQIRNLIKENPDRQYYIIAYDIKNFKLLNDLFGRDVGDKVLVLMAEILNERTFPSELLGHFSGDRFVQVVKAEDLERTLDKFSRIFDKTPEILHDQNYSLIVHAGVYKIEQDETSVITMLDRAFLALSSVKDFNENRYAFYDDNMRRGLVWEQQITAALDSAIAERQFELYLQPQADKDGKMIGAEALVRWNHPSRGLLPPNQFIYTFEKNGTISHLDYYMWEKACILLSRWKRLGRDDIYVSVNLSPLDFYHLDVYDVFSGLVKKYDVSPKNLHIEITETAMMSDLEIKLPIIERLRLAGFKLAMDDFGSGYSSLNMLKDFPVDILKIDMAFLYRSKDAAKSKIIIQQVIELAKKLGMSTITEGVENETQMDFLKSIGCDMFQGYYFTKPLSVHDFEEKYFSPLAQNP